MPHAPLPDIRFQDLATALLARVETLLPSWLPGGRWVGHEWVCASLSGGSGRSCSVNRNNGHWADFAGDDKGGDLISLYAAIHGLDMGHAALQLARQEGLEHVAGIVTGAGASAPPPPPRRTPPRPACIARPRSPPRKLAQPCAKWPPVPKCSRSKFLFPCAQRRFQTSGVTNESQQATRPAAASGRCKHSRRRRWMWERTRRYTNICGRSRDRPRRRGWQPARA